MQQQDAAARCSSPSMN